jgi:MSHA biogenesis protein MshI
MLGKIIKSLTSFSKKPATLIAIHVGRSVLSLLEVKHDSIIRNSTLDYSADNWQQPLQQLLSNTPSRSRLHLVLAPEFYQVVQLDKPALSEAELLQALPWQVKDLVTIPPEDMLADYIDLPGYAPAQAKINVVVARLSWLKQLVQLVQLQGMQLQSVQPEEWLAQRLLPKTSHATMLVIQQPEQEVLIQIVCDGLLYFSRRTRGFSRMQLNAEPQMQSDMLDRLQLELQRSMDYFESQLKQPPVRDIRLLMPGAELMRAQLQHNGFSRVELLQPAAGGAELTAVQLLSYWPALAALQLNAQEIAA